MNSELVIDAVYTWVDMSDEKWRQKFIQKIGTKPDVNRYSDFGELQFSILLLLKYCPFIRNIYIVTDEQIPSWFVQDEYPNVFIIDHSQILGDECCQPTFKSDSIEAYLHRIPDLAEFYIYFNDDCFIGNHCSPYNFIDKMSGLPIARFKSATLNNNVKMNAIKGYGFSRGANLTNAMNCVKKIYKKHYNKMPVHQAVIMRKSMGELAWKLFPNELKKSVANPLRKPINDTISFINLSLLLGIATGRMKSETDRYSIKIYPNYSLSLGGANNNFNRLLKIRPQQFCINDINYYNYQSFRKFAQIYLSL
jgi:hypothetical protein